MPKFQAWIIKFGGSLAGTPALDACLRGLAAAAWPSVLVPGGGVLSRAVRDAQSAWAFDDVVAHRMAILAMTQYGLVLASRAPGLTCVDLRTLENTPAKRPVVWLPRLIDVEAMDRAGIPNAWSVSADSIALWLGQHLASPGLLLVKSCTPEQLLGAPAVDADTLGLPEVFAASGRLFAVPKPLLPQLAANGVVDAALPVLSARAHAPAIYVYCLKSIV